LYRALRVGGANFFNLLSKRRILTNHCACLYTLWGFLRPAAPPSSGKIYTLLANLTSTSAGAVSREIGFAISVPFYLRSLLSGLAVAPILSL
jgi:hypothetical protein